jgi:hypothetical protein
MMIHVRTIALTPAGFPRGVEIGQYGAPVG